MAQKVSGRRPQGSGTTRQLASGKWQARYWDVETQKMKPAPNTFHTKYDAETWLGDFTAGDVVSTRDDETVAEWGERWLTIGLSTNRLKPKTYSDYRDLWPAIRDGLGQVRLSKLTAKRVMQWHGNLALSSPSPSTRAHTYSLLRAMMQSAVMVDIIPGNPCKVKGAQNVKRKHQIPTFDPEEAIEMITRLATEMPSQRYRLMILLAGFCQFRFGEITELRRMDVNFERRTITISRGVTRAKVGDEIKFIVSTPKTDASIRQVGIPDFILSPLENYISTLPDGPHQLLFPAASAMPSGTAGRGARSSKGNAEKHMAPGSFWYVFKPARIRAGVPSLRFHDLRHVGATLIAQTTDATIAELMALLGHSTSRAAMIYQHAAKKRGAVITSQLSAAISAKVESC